MPFRAIVFDFDGLICDTEGPDLQSWTEVFAEHEVELPTDWWTALIGTADGQSPHELLEQLAGSVDVASVRSRRTARFLELSDAAPLCDGVRQWLEDARSLGLSIGLATSAPSSWINRHLPRLGIDTYFDCIRTRDDVAVAKPAPDVYLSALYALGVEPDQAVAVEDSPNGARAAGAAGMKVVAVPNPLTASLPFDCHDVMLPRLADADLAQVLTRLSTG